MHEYYEFDQFINFKGPVAKKPKTQNFQPAFERFGQALLCTVITVTLKKHFDVTYLQTTEFADRSLFFKVPYLIYGFHVFLYMLYAGFSSFDANCTATGIGYRPATKTEIETSIVKRNMDMWNFSVSINGTEAFSNMHLMAKSWIKHYVMLRLMDRMRPKGAV